jgi:hypothetical protein
MEMVALDMTELQSIQSRPGNGEGSVVCWPLPKCCPVQSPWEEDCFLHQGGW